MSGESSQKNEGSKTSETVLPNRVALIANICQILIFCYAILKFLLLVKFEWWLLVLAWSLCIALAILSDYGFRRIGLRQTIVAIPFLFVLSIYLSVSIIRKTHDAFSLYTNVVPFFLFGVFLCIQIAARFINLLKLITEVQREMHRSHRLHEQIETVNREIEKVST
jgi:hypothetical protein